MLEGVAKEGRIARVKLLIVARFGVTGTPLPATSWANVQTLTLGNAKSLDGAIRVLETVRPQMVLVPIAPGLNGIDICREITTRVPDINVTVWSRNCLDCVGAAFVAGANSFVCQNGSLRSVLEVIKRIHQLRGRAIVLPLDRHAT